MQCPPDGQLCDAPFLRDQSKSAGESDARRILPGRRGREDHRRNPIDGFARVPNRPGIGLTWRPEAVKALALDR